MGVDIDGDVLHFWPAGGWINTSVSCLVKLPLWCCNYPNTCVISTLSNHYDIYSTRIVLTGGQTWSWSAVIVVWLADTQKDEVQQGSLYLVCPWFIYSNTLSVENHNEVWGSGWWLPQKVKWHDCSLDAQSRLTWSSWCLLWYLSTSLHPVAFLLFVLSL